MITYLALLRVPSWMALSGVQRRFVWRHCIHPLLTRFPLMIAKIILAFLCIIVGYWLGAFGSLVSTVITIIVLIFLLPELLDLCLVARHRQVIQDYIQSHGSEIQSVI